MPVTYARQGRIGVITIDNPPVNALSQAVRAGLLQAADAFAADDQADAAVILCAGRTWVAGADISEFGKPPAEPFLPDLIDPVEALWAEHRYGPAALRLWPRAGCERG